MVDAFPEAVIWRISEAFIWRTSKAFIWRISEALFDASLKLYFTHLWSFYLTHPWNFYLTHLWSFLFHAFQKHLLDACLNLLFRRIQKLLFFTHVWTSYLTHIWRFYSWRILQAVTFDVSWRRRFISWLDKTTSVKEYLNARLSLCTDMKRYIYVKEYYIYLKTSWKYYM